MEINVPRPLVSSPVLGWRRNGSLRAVKKRLAPTQKFSAFYSTDTASVSGARTLSSHQPIPNPHVSIHYSEPSRLHQILRHRGGHAGPFRLRYRWRAGASAAQTAR